MQDRQAEALWVNPPLDLGHAWRIAEQSLHHYNSKRLHSAIGYVAPADKLAGRDTKIIAECEQARERKRLLSAASHPTSTKAIA